MRTWLPTTLLGLALALAGVHAARWSRVPLRSGCGGRSDCSACHGSSALANHTAEFVERDHGLAARGNLAECLACHTEPKTDCDGCHRREPPGWHTEDFKLPGLGAVEQREHARVARHRRSSCGACHGRTFVAQCAPCHRPEEDWLRPLEWPR